MIVRNRDKAISLDKHKPIAGLDYWPDQSEWVLPTVTKPPTLIAQAFRFIAVFVILQVAWLALRDQAFGHIIRGDLTVKPAVMLINLMTPDIHANALGNQILAKGGGLVIKLGCEGVEAMFILIAAMLSGPLSRLVMLKGIVYGTLFIYVFNQARILTLFYTFRSDKSLFNVLHGTVAPLVLIALAALFFHWWLGRYRSLSKSGQVTHV